MKSCIILAAAPIKEGSLEIKDGDLVIAADAGYKNAEELRIEPDIILGDFDSLGFVPKGREIIKHPVMKDDTDTMLAVKVGLERGYRRFYIFGGMGGRTDHTLANIATLAFIAEKGGRGYLISENECVTVIKNSSLAFSDRAKGTISVFATAGRAEGVTLTGLLYKLDNYTLLPSIPLGVSNSFTGEMAEISVKSGLLTILWNGGTDFVREAEEE